jgi:hypothetical protein
VRKLIPFVVSFAILALAGTPVAAADVQANDLKQIGLAYHNHLDAAGKPPANAKALAPYFCNSKKLLDYLESKTIVFIYGVGIRDMTAGTSNTVLAYVKDVPTKGGLVLMGDGSVRKMSADEFKKATLAKKK